VQGQRKNALVPMTRTSPQGDPFEHELAISA
jgi:hypothetical protein